MLVPLYRITRCRIPWDLTPNVHTMFLPWDTFYFRQNRSNFCCQFLAPVLVSYVCSDSVVTHRKGRSSHWDRSTWGKSRPGLMTSRILMWKVSEGCAPDTDTRFWLHWNMQNVTPKTSPASSSSSLTHSFRKPKQWPSWRKVRISASSGRRKYWQHANYRTPCRRFNPVIFTLQAEV